MEHLPPISLQPTLDALATAGYDDVAITLSAPPEARLGDPLQACDAAIAQRGARLLFLDADDDALVRRFSTTRRRHPRHAVGSLREAISVDRHAMAPFRERASIVLDTTNLTHGTLKARIAASFARRDAAQMAVTLVAFGFKYGLPVDLDLLFDVRFLRNPNYAPDLAPLTGADPAVGAFIARDDALEPFLVRCIDLLALLIPRYVAEGKAQLTIGIGCTGGRHRSVYVARQLAERLARTDAIEVALEARDVQR